MTDTIKNFEQQISSTLCLVSCSSKNQVPHFKAVTDSHLTRLLLRKKSIFRSGLPICHELWDIESIFFSLSILHPPKCLFSPVYVKCHAETFFLSKNIILYHKYKFSTQTLLLITPLKKNKNKNNKQKKKTNQTNQQKTKQKKSPFGYLSQTKF